MYEVELGSLLHPRKKVYYYNETLYHLNFEM